ncbi:MAG: carbohydrate ABC transporter permease [Phycisphaerales bacterium]|nr:carbohydrate ABC transporter permease [Phycisphaerales bacterium]
MIPGTRPALVWRLLAHLAVWGVALSMAAPLLWMLLTALKTEPETTAPVTWASLLPRSPQWGNFVRAWREAGLGAVLFNTLLVSLLTTLLAVAHNALAGYALARLRFRGARAALWACIGAMLLPMQVTFLFAYAFADRLGYTDTLAGLIVPFLSSGFGILMMREACARVPASLLEAARLDGLGTLGVFMVAVRPALRASLAALAVITFVNAWNAFFWPLLMVDSASNRTMSLAVADLSTGLYVQSWPVQMAAGTILVLPLVLVYLVAQRAFQGAFAGSGLKEGA